MRSPHCSYPPPPLGPVQGGKEVQLTTRGAAAKTKRLLDEAARAINCLDQPPMLAAKTCATATLSCTVDEGVECTNDCVNGETISQLTSPGAGEQQQVSKAQKSR